MFETINAYITEGDIKNMLITIVPIILISASYFIKWVLDLHNQPKIEKANRALCDALALYVREKLYFDKDTIKSIKTETAKAFSVEVSDLFSMKRILNDPVFKIEFEKTSKELYANLVPQTVEVTIYDIKTTITYKNILEKKLYNADYNEEWEVNNIKAIFQLFIIIFLLFFTFFSGGITIIAALQSFIKGLPLLETIKNIFFQTYSEATTLKFLFGAPLFLSFYFQIVYICKFLFKVISYPFRYLWRKYRQYKNPQENNSDDQPSE